MNRGPIRWRALLALTAVVFAVHVVLLRPAPGVVQAARERHRPIVTRMVAAQPAPFQVAAAVGEPVPIATPIRPGSVEPLREQTPQRTQPRQPLRAAGLTVAAAGAPSAKPRPQPAQPRRGTGEGAAAVADPVLLHYQVTAHTHGFTLNGTGQLHWRHDGKDYDAKLELSGALLPSRIQQSTGRITPQGLEPLRFSDKSRREEAAHFQRDEGKVSFSSNRPDAQLAPGAQDRLSVMLQLGALAAGEPKRFRPGATISVQTAGTRDAEVWQFTVEGEESLQLPGGELKALKLIRNPRKEFDQKVELWLAPGMDYVPVRLRLTQPNGDWVDQQWSSTDKR